MTDTTLSITIEQNHAVAILAVAGRMNGGNVHLFQDAAQHQIDAGRRVLVFDLGHLTYVSSAGLRAFLTIAKAMERTGGTTMFCALTPEVAEIFDVSGFNEILTVKPTTVDALRQTPRYPQS